MKLRSRMILVFGVATALSAGGAAYALATDDQGVAGDDAQRAADAAIAAAGGGSVSELEADDGGYDVEVVGSDGRTIDVVLGADFEVRSAQPDGGDDGDDGDDQLDTLGVDDPDHAPAAEAAIAEAGGGTVVEVERDGTGYDVDVRRDDGTHLEVELGADFSVIGSEVDD